jgi:hypothetical protein
MKEYPWTLPCVSIPETGQVSQSVP